VLFSWLKRRRRTRLRAEPFAEEWEKVLQRNLPRAAQLGETERDKLRGDIQIFVAEKNWEGVFGVEMADEIRVTIAAQACWMILGLDVSLFDHVLSILVYPDTYSAPEKHAISGGGVIEGSSQRLGEAWHRGPIVLSWPDVLSGGRNPASGRNLVFHEFAHQLDMLNGGHVDGIPPIESLELATRWQQIVAQEYERLQFACRHRRPRLMDCYGTTNRGEFFAVATETFFQWPARMRNAHPELYAAFRDYFRLDPAERAALTV